VTAFVIALCGNFSNSKSSTLANLGTRSSLIFSWIFGAVFLWRGFLIYGVEEKAYLFNILAIMGAGSFLASFVIYSAVGSKKLRAD